MSQPGGGEPSVTRRGFIAGSAALSAPLMAAEPDLPRYSARGSTLVVSFGGEWVIDPAPFSDGAIVYDNVLSGPITIRVVGRQGRQPRFVGTDLYCPIEIEILWGDGRWVVDISVRGRRVQRSPLAIWCGGAGRISWRETLPAW